MITSAEGVLDVSIQGGFHIVSSGPLEQVLLLVEGLGH
jgi:hypothetical protein